MKKILILLTLLSFVVAAPFAIAKEKAKKDEPKVSCCVDYKGKCQKKTADQCTKAKGEVVGDCKECQVNCLTKDDCKKMTVAQCNEAKGRPVKKCKPPKTPKP